MWFIRNEVNLVCQFETGEPCTAYQYMHHKYAHVYNIIRIQMYISATGRVGAGRDLRSAGRRRRGRHGEPRAVLRSDRPF